MKWTFWGASLVGLTIMVFLSGGASATLAASASASAFCFTWEGSWRYNSSGVASASNDVEDIKAELYVTVKIHDEADPGPDDEGFDGGLWPVKNSAYVSLGVYDQPVEPGTYVDAFATARAHSALNPNGVTKGDFMCDYCEYGATCDDLGEKVISTAKCVVEYVESEDDASILDCLPPLGG